jgi:hypothetical protein
MSTDYGFFCDDCKIAKTFDNLRSYAVFDAMRSAKELVELHVAMENIGKSKCEEITLAAYWCDDIRDLVKFFGDHKCHKVFVCDEYGSTYDVETQERHKQSLIPGEDIWSVLELNNDL